MYDEIWRLGYTLGYQHPYANVNYSLHLFVVRILVTTNVENLIFRSGYISGQNSKRKELNGYDSIN